MLALRSPLMSSHQTFKVHRVCLFLPNVAAEQVRVLYRLIRCRGSALASTKGSTRATNPLSVREDKLLSLRGFGVMPHGFTKHSSSQMAEQYKVSFSQGSRLFLSQVTQARVANVSNAQQSTCYLPLWQNNYIRLLGSVICRSSLRKT